MVIQGIIRVARNSIGRKKEKRRAFLFRKQGGLCALCGGPMRPNGDEPDSITLDHVLPRSRGGSNHINNLQGAHKLCNTRRGNRPILGVLHAWQELDAALCRALAPFVRK